MGLFVDELALGRLSGPFGEERLPEYLLAVEGVSHFVYVMVRARAERPFSGLELELQAEVDKYLLSLPMWNFGIPYTLKHYIDVLVQPGLTFSYTPSEGYKGLVTGRPAAAVYARGGAYGPGSGAENYDKQSDYLRHILGFIGLTDVKQIFVEPTLAGPDAKEKAVAMAKENAEKLARTF